jgi:hypothetical protein
VSADTLLADVAAQRDLNEAEARCLVDSIRVDVADIGERVATAYLGRAWMALGYPSWDALCEAEFDGARLRIPREQRAEQVQSLRAAGLSTRAIGTALGVSEGTVRTDLAGAQNYAPAPVVGQDGKQYAPTQPPRPQPSPSSVAPGGGESAHVTETMRTTQGTKVERDVDLRTGEVLAPEPGVAAPEAPAGRPSAGAPLNPVAAARNAVAKQPAMLAAKAVERLHTARLLLAEAGDAAEIVADLAHDGLADGDQGHDWLPELDAALPLLNDLAAALRRRNLRSVR